MVDQTLRVFYPFGGATLKLDLATEGLPALIETDFVLTADADVPFAYEGTRTGVTTEGHCYATLKDSSGNALGVILHFDLRNATGTYEGHTINLPLLADQVLQRSVSTVEGHTAEHTLAGLILHNLEWEISGTDLIVYGTDGTTTRFTKTITTAAEDGTVITKVN